MSSHTSLRNDRFHGDMRGNPYEFSWRSRNGKVRLSREYIVPYALNGNWVLPKASCEKCRAITQRYEDACLRVMFKPLRTRLGMQSRSPKQAYIEVEVVHHDGRRETLTVPHKDFPVIAYGIYLPIAGIVLGQAPKNIVPGVFLFRFHEGELENCRSQFAGIARIGGIDITAFMRMPAKIGYSYAAAEIGPSSLHPMLADLVLAKAPNSAYLSYLVGGDAEPAPKGDFSHRIEMWEHTINGVVYNTLNALVCLSRQVLKQPFPELGEIERAKRPRRVPTVFTTEEVTAVLTQLSGVYALMASLL